MRTERQLLDVSAAARADRERGLYAYCVTAAGQPPPGAPGVDSRYPLDVLEHRELTAVVSEVELSEFGEQALKERLEDLGFVERIARAHDAVVLTAHGAGGACPMSVCTIFTAPQSVRQMLDREHDSLLASLARVRGREEWSVKVLADPRTVALAEPRLASDRSSSPGRAFFERKRFERERLEEVTGNITAAAREIHTDLAGHAGGALMLTAQNRAISERDGEMALNGAYLVDREQSEQFAARAREVAERHRRLGLSLVLSGPFAPYSFVVSDRSSRS
jgi:hypothetical protein